VEIVSCPECGRPRALGHRCPSCGDIAAGDDEQSRTPERTNSWQEAVDSWQIAAASGPYQEPGQAAIRRPVAARPPQASGGKKKRGLLAPIIVAVAVIAVAAVVAVVLTTGGAAVVEESASAASAPEKAYDQAAQSLIRNAMTALDSAFVESADYTAVTQDTLKMIEPSIAWVPGREGVFTSPAAEVNAQQNAVGWICTGRLGYELGTWSASGMEFGVRVNKAGGGTTYYRGGAVGAW
jgi:hypothetical protein